MTSVRHVRLTGGEYTPIIVLVMADGMPGTRPVRSLAVLGDSTAVGLCDPLPGGGWRGFGPLLTAALGGPGEVTLTNLAFTGARMHCVRQRQLPAALRIRPQVVAMVVGMNDTLRSDFNAGELHEHLDAVVAALHASGAAVLITRFHEHGRIFRLPAPLRRALHGRIAAVNDMIDAVTACHGAGCLDLHTTPGTYDLVSWSVDRLHPSELGHRLLARGFADLLSDAGFAVPFPVELTCVGGRRTTGAQHAAWLVARGLPWLWHRGRDLVPYGTALFVRELVGPLAGYAVATDQPRHLRAGPEHYP